MAVILLLGCSVKSSPELGAFASCLTEKGAEMYGTYWCSHCQAQKEMFESSFSKINYIECTVDVQKCKEAGVTGYPTWKFKDGSVLGGVQDFTVLAKKTGCSLS